MAKKTLKRKELKQPDQFVTFWGRVAAFAAAHARQVAAVGVAVVVFAVGVSVFTGVADRKAAAATQALAQVHATAFAELRPAEGKDETTGEASDGSQGGAGEGASKTGAGETLRFADAPARAEATLKEVDQFLKEHGGSKLAPQARLVRASALVDLQKFDEAAAEYQGLLAGKLDQNLRFLAWEGLGYAHEAKGDLDKALAAFDELQKQAGGDSGFYADRALFHKARIKERQGLPGEALAYYRQALEKSPDKSNLREEINSRLSALESN